MPDFAWIAQEQELTPVALTVRAQTIDPTDQGRLLWDLFLPRRNVDQTKLASLTTRDVRITTDRREWNTRGRYINLVTPPRRELEWIPVEGYFKLEEQEINALMNEVRGNQALFRQVIGARIPERTDMLVQANYRRLEVDCMTAWANGNIVYMNPQTGVTVTVSYGFDTARYQTAGTAWNVVANAYNEFLAWLEDGFEQVGPYEGVMLRQATWNAIMADAPNPAPAAITASILPTQRQVIERIQDETGRAFSVVINENTVETYTDGGITRQTVKVWTAEKIALIPAGFAIGNTAFAPVVRAYDLSSQVPDAGVDIRGQTIYHEVGNGGRELTVEGQFNPMPDPDESKLWVIDVGV